MASKKPKIDNQIKELAMSILKTKEIEYEEWLNEKFNELISENTKLLIDSLAINTKSESK